MIKKAAVFILAICLFITTGCTGIKPGTASGSMSKISSLLEETPETAYVVETVDFPEPFCCVWLKQIADRVFLLGQNVSGCYLYSMNCDGSDVQLLASCNSVENVQWQTCCILDDYIYVYACVNDEADSYSHHLIAFDKTGKKTGVVILPDDLIVDRLVAGGKTLYAVGNGKVTAFTTTQEGHATFLYTISISPQASVGQTPDGNVYIAWEDQGRYAISLLNKEKQQLTETRFFDARVKIVGEGTTWDLYLLVGTSLFGYNFSNEKLQKILSFSDYGLFSDGYVCEVNAGKILYTGTKDHLLELPKILTPVTKTDDDMTLIMATIGPIHPQVNSAILEWNRKNPYCRIVVRDYGTVSEADGGGELKLALDIASGNAPDLYNLFFSFGSTMNASLFARRQLLEDLYPFIDNDPELSRDDFFAGLLQSLEINGGLYHITPYYELWTMSASKEDVGHSDNWTYDYLQQVVEKNDKYDYLFDQFHRRDDWLRFMVTASGGKLVDWANGKCYFDSEYFIRLLEMSKERPAEGVPPVGGWSSDVIRNSRSLLYTQTYGNVRSAESLASEYGAENYVFVGLPEIGSVVMPEASIGISVTSHHKQLCWTFLRSFLVEDSRYTYGITMRRDIANQSVLDCLKQSSGYSDEDREKGMRALLEELEVVDTLYQVDSNLWRIIEPEVGRFFSGQKSATEVAKVIQSRATLYLTEQGLN